MPTTTFHKNGSTDPDNPTQSTAFLVGSTNQVFELGNGQTGPVYFAYTVGLFAGGTTTITAMPGVNVAVDSIADVASNLVLNIQGNSSIDLDGGLLATGSAVTTNFSGIANGTFTVTPGFLSTLSPSAPTVTGFATGDKIGFDSSYDTSGTNTVAFLPNNTHTGGTLTLIVDGQPQGSVVLSGSYVPGDFQVVEGADGNADIIGCFLRGTRILTANGYVAVERLAPGDLVMTLANGAKPITSVKLRSFSSSAQRANPNLRPVCIAAGALAEDIPIRMLRVSADHAMYFDGVLVPAQLLINGETITQPVPTGEADYFHVETELHDIIIAEGAAAETYLDIGNHNHFSRPGLISLAAKIEPKNWEDACAPLVLAGPELQRVTAVIEARASQLNVEPAARAAA